MKLTVDLSAGQGLLATSPASVSVLSGDAEVWGADLRGGLRVEKAGVPVLISTSSGCRVELEASLIRVLPQAFPKSWESLSGSLKKGDRVMLLGGVDSGKSSLSLYLLNRAVSSGLRAALVDSDVGQSDVGPPGTIGVLVRDRPVIHPRLEEADHIFFVGDTSPRGHFLQMIVGLREAVSAAYDDGAELVIVNTTGFVSGGAARALKSSKMAIVKPSKVVLMGRTPRFDRHVPPSVRVLSVEPLPQDAGKDHAVRRETRRLMFSEILSRCRPVEISARDVYLLNTMLFSGDPCPEHVDTFSKVLEVPVVYLEECEDAILVIAERRPARSKTLSLSKMLGKEVRVGRVDSYRGLYVGLLNSEGSLSGLGIIADVDFSEGRISLLSQVEEFSGIALGWIRLSPSGEEVGRREVDEP